MSTEAPPHRVGTRAQRDRAVEIVVDAFYCDPTWAHAFPDDDARREQHRWYWGLFVDGALRYDSVWLDRHEVAVAVWLPPEGTELGAEQEAELEPGLRERLGAGADAVLRALDRFDAHHPHDEPHHYLTLLATDTAHLGRGHGLGLLADTLAYVDRLGGPCYLEASNLANVPLYERFGFVELGRFAPFDHGPDVATMWRAASSRPPHPEPSS